MADNTNERNARRARVLASAKAVLASRTEQEIAEAKARIARVRGRDDDGNYHCEHGAGQEPCPFEHEIADVVGDTLIDQHNRTADVYRRLLKR